MKNPSAAVSNSDLSNLSLDEEYNKLFGVPDEDDLAESTSGGRKKKKKTSIQDMREMRQKEIVLLNLRKEERSLETELQFGLNIYISLIVSIVFFVPGLFLTFYAFGLGDVFKTDNNQIKIPFLILSIFCYLPLIIWCIIVFCPRREEYLRRKSIRLERKLRAAIEAKRKAIYFDEEEVLKETEVEINKLEIEIKALQAEQLTLMKNKRAGRYVYKDSSVRITSRNDFFGSKSSSNSKVAAVVSSLTPPVTPVSSSIPSIVPLRHPTLITRPAAVMPTSMLLSAPSSNGEGIRNTDARVSFNLSDQKNIRLSRSSSKRRMSASGRLK